MSKNNQKKITGAGKVMIEILLCDDEESCLHRIRDYLYDIRERLPEPMEVTEYSDPEKVLSRLRCAEEKSDILIADIDMPSLSGMEMARIIREEKLDVILIFMTAHAEYVYESFEFSPFRYIRKEYMEKELLLALRASWEVLERNRDTSIVIKTLDGIMSLKAKDIVYFELENRKCHIYTIQRKVYVSWKKIKELCSELEEKSNGFIRVHSGCVVNKRYIQSIEKADIILETGERIPFSRRKRKEISDTMMEYWEKML